MRTVTWLLVVGTVLAQSAAGDAPQDDAGTGGDAGNARTAATPLPGLGTYAGELRSLDDDWFVASRASGPACVQLDASGDTDASVTLSLRSSGAERSVRAPLASGGTTRLALAGSAVDRAWVGVESTRNPAGNDAARPRAYAFALNASAAGADADAGTGMDAAGTLAEAMPVAGGCIGGSLRPLAGLGDTRDAYAFPLAAGAQVVYSLGSTTGVSLQPLDPSGQPIGDLLLDEGVATFTAPVAGTYYMRASTTGGAETLAYVIGLLGPDPPPGSPCRPHCMAG